MADKTDYTFMKSGFAPVDNGDEIDSAQENVVALIVTYAEHALRSAAIYVSHGDRREVTPEDVKRAMMLEMFLFGSRPGLLEKAKDIKEELFPEEGDDEEEGSDEEGGDDEEDGSDEEEEDDEEEEGDEEDDEEGSGIVASGTEVFAPNSCSCALCSCINNIYARWDGWEPSNAFETIFKTHIDNI